VSLCGDRLDRGLEVPGCATGVDRRARRKVHVGRDRADHLPRIAQVGCEQAPDGIAHRCIGRICLEQLERHVHRQERVLHRVGQHVLATLHRNQVDPRSRRAHRIEDAPGQQRLAAWRGGCTLKHHWAAVFTQRVRDRPERGRRSGRHGNVPDLHDRIQDRRRRLGVVHRR
jgi:hypothetical protein